MARKNKAPKARELSLEEQLRVLDENAPPGPLMFDGPSGLELATPSAERMEYVRKRADIVARLRKREAKALADPGPDEGGRMSPSPYALQHGHRVETAPKSLGKELPKDGAFPKRVATQRVIDRYKAHGHIDHLEWLAANRLWELWVSAGAEFRVCAGYDPVFIQASPSVDHIMAKRVDAAVVLNDIWSGLPRRSRGCVRAVVIEDMPAADWARMRGYGDRASKVHGMDRLRLGLQGLVGLFGLDKLHRT